MNETVATSSHPPLAQPGDFVALMKPRVMSLVVFTTLVGMLLSPGEVNPFLLMISMVAIATGAGASGAINQWYDRDIDELMLRTRLRPLPAGKIDPTEALSFGIIMSAFSVLVLWLSANASAALLLGFTIFFYGVIYTIWLKRRTPQNIVIGGAAGAFPPMIGWLAAGGGWSWEAFVLFAIIFIWTPPHFWALALVKNEDYKRAQVPMLPVVAGAASTRLQILLYSIVLFFVALLPFLLGMVSALYGLGAGLLGFAFLYFAVRLFFKKDDASAMGLFKFSILYLFLLFLLLGLDGFIAPVLGIV